MSITQLKTSVDELTASNLGITRAKWSQVSSSKDVSGDQFNQGVQHYRWELPSGRWWMPSKSYFRFRCRLVKGGNPVVVADDVAPAMNCASNFYQSCEFQINNQTVSKVSDYVAEIDTLTKRQMMSKAQMDQYLGNLVRN